MNFLDALWLIIVAFFFISYIGILFAIIRDLFRDGSHNGWWKAVWIVFLLFVPLLTSLVYLIVNSRGMAEREAASVQHHRAEAETYLKDVVGRSAATEIADAAALLQAGTITEAEFQTLKAKAIAA
ncbi:MULTISPECIES: PLDc N-terminal domain-containing protein [unclassified Plantibacter]|uniref:PLDc N-terminal domain-containing protein n=1 Tax=unclassified Plantibacter TaxID=2624265 RepID=UPI003D3421A2